MRVLGDTGTSNAVVVEARVIEKGKYQILLGVYTVWPTVGIVGVRCQVVRCTSRDA